MSYKVLGKEKNDVTFSITLGADAFEKATQAAYLKNRGKFNLPGFRKGKTPRKMLESQYGEGLFFEDALNDLLAEAYPNAVEELGLDVVDRPNIDVKEMEKGKDIIVEATVTVKPEVTIDGYKGVEVEKVEANVTDEDVDAEIEKSREMNGRLVVVEDRAVEDGDTTIIDFRGTIDGEAFEGGSGENFTLVIGSGQFIPGYEEQLIGKNAGEEVDVKVTFPEDYHAEDLAGKEAVFATKINEIKVKELPALDDEFAKDTSEFDTLEELKADTKAKLQEAATRSAESATRDRIIDAVVEKMEADIPAVMIEGEIDGMLRDLNQQLQYQGMSLDMYLQFSGQKIDDMREQMKEDAEMRVKTSLALEAITKLENVEVTDEEVDAEFAKIGEAQKKSADDIKKLYGEDGVEYIKATIKTRKTVDILVDNANFK
ncbi:MAG: trigger factor [Clostridia bacterium]|nr:trigger factor [Clostridia bacterium]